MSRYLKAVKKWFQHRSPEEPFPSLKEVQEHLKQASPQNLDGPLKEIEDVIQLLVKAKALIQQGAPLLSTRAHLWARISDALEMAIAERTALKYKSTEKK